MKISGAEGVTEMNAFASPANHSVGMTTTQRRIVVKDGFLLGHSNVCRS